MTAAPQSKGDIAGAGMPTPQPAMHGEELIMGWKH